MIVKIHTSDQAWINRNAVRSETLDNGNTVAYVEIGDTVERLTFGPKRTEMIRFDLSKVAKRIPSDWYNKAAMIPVSHIVTA